MTLENANDASSPVAEPPADATPRFRNPVMDKMFRRSKLRSEPVTVEVDGESFEFIVHEMSVAMKGRFEAMMSAASVENDALEADEIEIDDESMGTLTARVVAACVATADGRPIVQNDEWRLLLEMPNRMIDPLFRKAIELAGIGRVSSVKQAEADAENV